MENVLLIDNRIKPLEDLSSIDVLSPRVLRAIRGKVRAMLTRINNYGPGIIQFEGKNYVCSGATTRYLLLKKQLFELGVWNPEYDVHFDSARRRQLNKGKMYQIKLIGEQNG